MPELVTITQAQCDNCKHILEQSGAYHNINTNVLLVTYTCPNPQCGAIYFCWDNQFAPGMWKIILDQNEINALIQMKLKNQ